MDTTVKEGQNGDAHPVEAFHAWRSIAFALAVGVGLNCLLIGLVYLFFGRKTEFYFIGALCVSHMVLIAYLLVFKRGCLFKDDIQLIRFGPMLALWKVLQITG